MQVFLMKIDRLQIMSGALLADRLRNMGGSALHADQALFVAKCVCVLTKPASGPRPFGYTLAQLQTPPLSTGNHHSRSVVVSPVQSESSGMGLGLWLVLT